MKWLWNVSKLLFPCCKATANTNGVEFILSYMTIDNFLFTCRSIEIPRPTPTCFHQGNRHWPAVWANFYSHFIFTLFYK